MPLFYFECKKCKVTKRTLHESTPKEHPVCRCGKKMKRAERGPTHQVKERIDNGIMSRAVESYPDAAEVSKNRKPPKGPINE
jgi:hypothetical protein